jgi:ABC-type branched-subunit amino acid transport system substrate-binding protein
MAAASAFALASGAAPAAARLGVELPLAGLDGNDGIEARQAVQLALDDWNADPAHTRVEAVIRDTSLHGHENPHLDEGLDNVDQPANAVAILRDFAADPRILAIVGALRTNVATAEAPIAADLGLAVVSIGASSAPAPERAPALFRIAANDAGAGALAGTLARRHGYRRVAVIGRAEPAARAVARGFERTFPNAAPNGTAPDAVLYAAPLERGVFLAPPAAAAVVLGAEERRRMEHRGYGPPPTQVPYDRVERASVLDRAAAAGVAERYHARFGFMPSVDALDAYVATEIALAAIARAGGTEAGNARARTLAALRAGGLPSTAGPLGFTRDGSPRRSCFEAVTMQDGRTAASARICR